MSPKKRSTVADKAPKEYLEASEASSIEDAATSLRDKLLIRMFRRLGCRVSEVLHLEEKHIDYTMRQVKIEHEKMRIALFCPYCRADGNNTRLGKKATFCPTCGKTVKDAVSKATLERNLRKIPVDKDTLDLITLYIKKGGVTEMSGKRMLFNISRQRAWQIVKTCAERAGFFELTNPKNDKLHHVSPHKFRDSFAINAMKRKPTFDDARLLQEILGHANINTTMNYRKVKGAEVQDYYDSLTEYGDE